MSTYILPAEISFALMTRRPELAELLRGRIQRGEVLTQDEMLGIVDAAVELVRIQAEVERQINAADQRLHDIQAQLNGCANMIESFRERIKAVGTDEEAPR